MIETTAKKSKKSLKGQGNELSNPTFQLKVLSNRTSSEGDFPAFAEKLKAHDLLPFKSTGIEIMQINVGYMCNQTCEHCHVDAGPDRKEIMTKETMRLCLDAIEESDVHTVDLTGGAPEMNPDFQWFVIELKKKGVEKIIVRSNLTILVSNPKYRSYIDFFKEHQLTVIASLPCYTKENTDSQRGDGVFDDSLEALQLLNNTGYGKEGSGLELHLVFNPGGASLPGPQETLKQDYKRELSTHFGIVFNDLYTITNLPISRFLDFLLQSGKYEHYMSLLVNSFNPLAAEGVMCRNTLSVGWKGSLYDCDFNQMLELKVENNAPQHIKDFNLASLEDRNIIINQHCYGCTAGAGSSCQGAIA